MTKRLLAIALVVLVAVSCVYLPSVVASAAEGDVVVVNKEAYEKDLVDVTFKVSQYTYDTVKVPAGALADEAKLLKWAQDNLEAETGLIGDKTIVALAPVEGQEKTYNVETVTNIKVQFQGHKIGEAGTTNNIGDPIEVATGTPVSEVTAKAPTAPLFPGKTFMYWDIYANLDRNADGKIDDNLSGTVNVQGVYGTYTGVSVYFYAADQATAQNSARTTEETAAIIKGNQVKYNEDGTVKTTDSDFTKVVNALTDTNSLSIPYGANPYDYLPKVVTDTANKDNAVAKVENFTVDSGADSNNNTYKGKTFKFKSWKQLAPAQNGTLQFVATYEEVTAPSGSYTYKFELDGDEDYNDVDPIVTDTLTVNADEIANKAVKDAVDEYLKKNTNKRFDKWELTTDSSNVIKFKAKYVDVSDYTFYYLDEAGFVTKSTAKYYNEVEALLAPAPAVADGYTFTKWTLGDASKKVINSMYVEGADDSELPAAKDGAASFKMAESLAADYFGEGVAPTVGKTVTLKVTGAAATFDTAVEDVNEAIKVNFTGINCDVTSEGNVATVTLTGEGTAYVVATVSYQGDVYTKTFTVTGIK